MSIFKFADFKVQHQAAFVLAGWTTIMAILLAISWNGMQTHILEIARTEARTSIAKDILYREWNSKHGGVYALVTEDTQPNPYLNVPERDIFTPSGKLLTLINPAYMNRQVFQSQDDLDIHAHLTSLKPINPNNETDPWEKEALLKFENGMSEVSSVEEEGGESFMRLMIPFRTTEACLKCHAVQGYKVGDIRGGLSVSIPLSKYAGLRQSYLSPIAWGYGTIWLVGIVSIYLASKALKQKERERESVLLSLRKNNEKLESSENKFSKIFQFSPALVLLTKWEDTRIADVNNKFLEVFGFTRDEVIGKTAIELGLMEDQEREKFATQLFLKEHIRDTEVTFRNKDGRTIVCSYNGELIDLEGTTFILTLMQDVTAQKQAEKQLRESETSLKLSQKIAHVGHWIWDTQTNLVTWSDEMYRIFGLDHESFTGNLDEIIANAIHPEDREKVNASNQTVLTDQKPAPMEYRVVWPDQSIHTVWAVPGGRVTDDNGKILKLTGIVQDISERKEVEISLQDSENLLLQAQQVAHLGYYQLDIESGIWKSSALLDEIFGIGKDYIKDVQGWAGIVHPDERQGMTAYFADEVLGKRKNFDREYRIMRISDQVVRWVHGMGELQFDPQGTITRMIGTIQDITERKEVEESLRISEERFRTLVTSSDDIIFTLDTAEKHTGIFGKWLEKTNIKPEFFLGRTSVEIMGEEAGKVHHDANLKALCGKNVVYEWQALDGPSVIYYQTSLSPMYDGDGQVMGIVGIGHNITQLKNTEFELRGREAHLKQAQYLSKLGIWEWDPITDKTTWSDEMLHIYGITREQFTGNGQDYINFTHPDDRELQQSNIRKDFDKARQLALETGLTVDTTPEPKEFRIIRPDGNVRWVQGDAIEYVDEQGNPVRMLGILRDITSQKLHEQAIRESEARYRNLFEEMMDGFALHEIICDSSGQPVDYRFLAINPPFEKLTGLQSRDTLGKTVLEIMPATEKVWIERYGHVALTGIPDQFEEFSAAFNTYYEVRAFSPVPNHFAVIFHDISQRKFAENITLARMKIVEIATTHSLDTLLQTILDEAERLTGSCIGFYHFLDADQKTISLQNWSTRTLQEFCQATGKGTHYPVDKAGVWVDCVHAREPVIHNDYASLPHRKGLPEGHAKIVREMVVPVMRSNRIVAILGVGNKSTDYTHRDVDIVEQLADLAMEIVERKRSEKEIIEKNADLAALFSISAHLRTASSANEMMPLVLQQMGSVLNSDANAVILFDPGNHSFVFSLADGALESNTGMNFGVENSISRFVMEARRPYITTDFARDPNRTANIKDFENLGPAMLVPLQSETEFIGCLLCARSKDSHKGDFSHAEVQLLISIGEMVGTALRRTRLYDDALLRLKRVQGLRAIDAAMTTNMDINVTLNILVTQALTLMGMDAANVLTFNPITRTLNHAAGQGFHSFHMESAQLRLGEGAAGQAALECKTISVPDISSEQDTPHKEILKKEGFQSMFVAPMVTKGQMRGVLELFSRKPYSPDEEWLDFLEALATQAAIAIDASQLYKDLQRSHLELSMAYDATIEGWSHALDLKDKETEGHTLRVTDWTIKLASLAGMSETEIVHVRRGALLHDIGKMGIPDHILGKTGKLTPQEWEIMRQHPVYGYNMIRPIEFLRPAVDIPYCHHEKWDGTGYPRGLKAEQIPYAARLFAIVDVWDAITSDRPYRKAWSFDEALEYVKSERGKQFDPQIVDLFLQLVDELTGSD